MKETRDIVFSIRLTNSELVYLKNEAESRGQTIGGYIRWVIFSKKENK